MPSETKTSSHLWLGLLRFLVLLSKFVYQLATHVHNVNKCGMDNEPVPTKRCNGLWGCGDAGYRVFCFACERLLATNHAFSSALSSHKSLCPPPSDMATNTRVSGDVVCARTLHANLRGCRTGRGREGRVCVMHTNTHTHTHTYAQIHARITHTRAHTFRRRLFRSHGTFDQSFGWCALTLWCGVCGALQSTNSSPSTSQA